MGVDCVARFVHGGDADQPFPSARAVTAVALLDERRS